MRIERIANSIFAVVILTLLWGLVPFGEPIAFQYAWRLIVSGIVLWYGVSQSFLRLPGQIWRGICAVYKFCEKLIDNATLNLFEIDCDDFIALIDNSLRYVEDEGWKYNGKNNAYDIKCHWRSYLRPIAFASLVTLAFNWLLGNVLVHFYSWIGLPVMVIVMFICIESIALLSIIAEDENEKLAPGSTVTTVLALIFTFIVDLVQIGRLIHAFITEPVVKASDWYDATYQLQLNFGTVGLSKAFLTLVGLFCLMLFFLANARIKYGKLDEIRDIIGVKKPQNKDYIPDGEE